MNIIESKNPHNRALPLQQLAHNTWYKGVASGRLYYHIVISLESEKRSVLIRCEDGEDCTKRYAKNGTFTKAEVAVVVTDDGFKVDWKPNELFEAVTGKKV